MRIWAAIKLIVTVTTLAFVAMALALWGLNCLFAAGTFPGDIKEQIGGLIWSALFTLAAVASVIGIGISIRRYRKRGKT
jgi:NADH:ubiquinone oxidoreductase subunit K